MAVNPSISTTGVQNLANEKSYLVYLLYNITSAVHQKNQQFYSVNNYVLKAHAEKKQPTENLKSNCPSWNELQHTLV